MTLSMQILVVEDDVELLAALKMGLKDEGFSVFTAETCEEARYLIQCWQFDAILLDGNLPDGDCVNVLKEMRRKDKDTPVMMLTARTGLDDKINSLDFGADDYVTKPFDFDELVARIYALLRRWTKGVGQQITIGDLCIRYRKRTVEVEGSMIELSSQEYAVLIALSLRVDQLVSRQHLFDRLSPGDDEVESNLLDVIIYTLRKKIGKNFIKTVKSQGYYISP